MERVFDSAYLKVAEHSVGLHYKREKGKGGSLVSIDDIAFTEEQLSQTAIAIKYHGFSGVDDNWLRLKDCAFYGFFVGTWLENCGQCHFHETFAQFNVICFLLGRSANVLYFSHVMCLSNRRFLHLDDELADGYTHGITLTNCHSINSFDTDIHLVGSQTVFINGCSFDLGYGGKQAIYLRKSQDIRIDTSWVCSGVESRDGIVYEDCVRWSLTNTTINNCFRGIVIKGPQDYPTSGVINSNQFGANRISDIAMLGEVTTTIIQANQFTSDPEGTFPDIKDRKDIRVLGNGNTHNIVTNNIFSSEKYDFWDDISWFGEIIGKGTWEISQNLWEAPGFSVSLELPKKSPEMAIMKNSLELSNREMLNNALSKVKTVETIDSPETMEILA